ncbi:MAG: hypothetical protein A2V84_13945 [Chloroflexi bacterium RBG_16_70_13]|nr:MAG: hypothetical protein A2V84_13945 [Chloroflexi bacterium RBG_16_70_13]
MTELGRFDAEELVRRLLEADVKFVLIGGLAAQAHGSTSLTSDLDIVPSWDRDNLRKVARILSDIAAVRHGVAADAPPLPPLDERTLLAGAVFTLTTEYGRFDLLANPDPGFDFDSLMRTGAEHEFLGHRLQVASLDDLIAMKRAAGRPKDRVELEILGALREEMDRAGRP